MFKIILVILIGISILTAECIYFCNRYYTSEIVDDNYIMKIKSKPAIKDKIVVSFFTIMVMSSIILIGWFTYREQRKRDALKSRLYHNQMDHENIDY